MSTRVFQGEDSNTLSTFVCGAVRSSLIGVAEVELHVALSRSFGVRHTCAGGRLDMCRSSANCRLYASSRTGARTNSIAGMVAENITASAQSVSASP
jgi:hypothetical protein